ncbi:MAG: gamma-glutamyl-gamma-aminobutyrate hydrolase family protein [Myxococcota bacterium]
MRRSDAVSYREPRDAIAHDWVRLWAREQLRPLLIPSTWPDPVSLMRSFGAQALLLTNGEDVELGMDDSTPSGQPRDISEALLLREALMHKIPVLAVCRGLQFVQVYFGGPLCRDVSTLGEQHVAVEHDVQLHGLFAEQVGQTQCTVNSFHRCGVTRCTLAKELVPLATTPQLVEAARHNTHPLLAVQWHPERPGSCGELDRYLFGTWLRESIP